MRFTQRSAALRPDSLCSLPEGLVSSGAFFFWSFLPFPRNRLVLRFWPCVAAFHPGVQIVAFAPNGQTLAAARGQGTILLRDLPTFRALAILKHDQSLEWLDFPADGEILLASDEGHTKPGTSRPCRQAIRAGRTGVPPVVGASRPS